MNEKSPQWVRALFVLAGIYDAALGAAFLVFSRPLFAAMGITPPNHFGYVHFAAALILLFGIMFFQIATDPARHRALIPYGIGIKVAYCGVVFFHALGAGLPGVWILFAWCDLAFLAAFVAAWRVTPRGWSEG
jgi:hypothetical protein